MVLPDGYFDPVAPLFRAPQRKPVQTSAPVPSDEDDCGSELVEMLGEWIARLVDNALKRQRAHKAANTDPPQDPQRV
jgi:hypothetical protein